jgi:hypothetical protein
MCSATTIVLSYFRLGLESYSNVPPRQESNAAARPPEPLLGRSLKNPPKNSSKSALGDSLHALNCLEFSFKRATNTKQTKANKES